MKWLAYRLGLLLTLMRVRPAAALDLFMSSTNFSFRRIALWLITGIVSLRQWLSQFVYGVVGKLLENSRVLQFLYRRLLLPYSSSARWFIGSSTTPVRFLTDLARTGSAYVVIRWGESVTSVDPHEDIDILCADADLETFQSSFQKASLRGQPVDIYSQSGVPGADYEGSPYFPKKLADFILESRRPHKSGILVPSPKAELFGLVYHLIFHKKWLGDVELSTIEHSRILARILELQPSKDPTETVTQTLSELAARQMLPPQEKCGMLIRENPSTPLSAIMKQSLITQLPPGAQNLLFLICRERLFSHNQEGTLHRLLTKDGLHVVGKLKLTPNQRVLVQDNSRGGNWGRGPYLRSGGGPVEIWLVWDSFPVFKEATHQDVNSVLERKSYWREEINFAWSPICHSNPLHTTDGISEGLELLEAIGEKGSLFAILEDVSDKQRRQPPKRTQSMSKPLGRSRVWSEQLSNGEEVVRKTFGLGFEEYLAREIGFYNQFRDLDIVPKLIDYDFQSIVIPKLAPLHSKGENARSATISLSPQQTARVVKFIQAVNARNFALVDFTPENLLVNESGEIQAIDFEFCQVSKAPEAWYESSDFRGLPPHSKLDRPNGWTYGLDHWDIVWGPATGMTLRKLARVLR